MDDEWIFEFVGALPGATQMESDVKGQKTALDLALMEKSGVSEEELRRRIAASPHDLDTRHQLSALFAARGRHCEALEESLEIVRRNRNFREETGRKMMLQIFEIIGPRSPLAEEYREKLKALLY